MLEKIKAAASALQMAESVKFAQSQAEAQLAVDVHPNKIGRGIADQIGLACRVSGFAAARRLGIARVLWFELPETYRLLVGGEISEYVACQVVAETRHLDAARRWQVDAQIAAAGLAQMGPKGAAACARKYAYQADPEGYVQRGRTERKYRRVGLRPAPALVERVTGQPDAADVNAEVQIVMALDALLDANDPSPVELEGYGPLPADLARDLLATSKGRIWWRRLYASPVGGPIVGGDPHRRRFHGHLRQLIMWRDRQCRDPFCEAPIRHIDHVQRYSDGGLTVYPNGRGECERGNYAREMPDWKVEAMTSGLDGQRHTIKITTPTGHSYQSRAP